MELFRFLWFALEQFHAGKRDALYIVKLASIAISYGLLFPFLFALAALLQWLWKFLLIQNYFGLEAAPSKSVFMIVVVALFFSPLIYALYFSVSARLEQERYNEIRLEHKKKILESKGTIGLAGSAVIISSCLLIGESLLWGVILAASELMFIVLVIKRFFFRSVRHK